MYTIATSGFLFILNISPYLDGRNTERVQQIPVNGLIILDRFRERYIDDLVVLDTHHHVTPRSDLVP